MIRGLYTAASGLLAQLVQNDLAANNLANVNTAGYKKDLPTFRTFPEVLIERLNDPDAGTSFNSAAQPPIIGQLGTGVALERVYTVHQPGSLRETDNPLDLAIDGDGYFVIQTPQGERYTRNGAFHLDSSRQLVTLDGHPVLGEMGPVVIQRENFAINEDGQVVVDGTIVDRLRLVMPADPSLMEKQGNNLFAVQQNQNLPGATARIRAGFLEMSNVNPVEEMVNIITVMRAYEANQKVIQAHDNLLDKAVNEVGRV